MVEMTVLELLGQARDPVKPATQEATQDTAPDSRAALDASEPALERPQHADIKPADKPAGIKPPIQPISPPPISAAHQACLQRRARQFPNDAARWEALLHNAWRLNSKLYWHLLEFRVGGAQLMAHAENGLALRFDEQRVKQLKAETKDPGFFSGGAEYRQLAGQYLAPCRDALARLLSLSSLGVIEDEDMSWTESVRPETVRAETVQRRAG